MAANQTSSSLVRYYLGMADGAHGPGDVPRLIFTDGGSIRGPDLPNWQKESMLGICEEVLAWRGKMVGFLAINPRYVGTTLTEIRKVGGVVGVSRILDGNDPRLWQMLEPTQLDYWGAGVVSIAS